MSYAPKYTTVIRIPDKMPVPEGAQINWALASAWSGIVRQDTIARLPEGAEIPEYCMPGDSEPEVTREDLKKVEEYLRQKSMGSDYLADLARADLDNLEETARRARGVAHPYAFHAPWQVDTLGQACRDMVKAIDVWSSPCSCAVIRASIKGYQFWTGIGSMIEHAGHATTYEEAERGVINAVKSVRVASSRAIRHILGGWSEDTPYYSTTIGTIDDLPIIIHRGPVSGAPGTKFGSSWDLPVVAEVRGEQITRFPERVTWDDEESREEIRERQRTGERRAAERVRRALDLLCSDRRVSNLVDYERGRLRPINMRAVRGWVEVHGPVRMREDGAAALALVTIRGACGPRPVRTWAHLPTLIK